ncbi:MAG: hypothetical protein EOO22_04535 [Comamonadaceae bacterium]|nr:MAG: hypothetical protein EOO22_04535 [Comamonadaceae bacterium]
MSPDSSGRDPQLEERRHAMLIREASKEFARVVYGLNDHASGRTGSMAALEITRTVELGQPVTRDRAEQRARAYLPVADQEHCPRCWVFAAHKNPLHFRPATEERLETARCAVCGAEYAMG